MLLVPNNVLQEIFASRVVHNRQGTQRPLANNISIAHANALYQTVLRYQPKAVIEVGMAQGISALAIATALREINKGGILYSIDPNQTHDYDGLGVYHLEKSDLSDYHRLIEDFDYYALPQLLKEGLKIDFAYIDGWHTFDYTLVDFFFVDKMLSVNGVVGFNDCALRAVKKVLGFVKTHRQYKEIDVGLKPSYLTRDIRRMARMVLTLTSKQDRYFEKQAAWEPPWDYFKSF